MQDNTLSNLEKLFLALADKTRLRLVGLMANGEVSVGFLVDQLGESQPKVSRHLAYLRSMGVVETRRDGKWIYYGLARQTDDAVQRVLNSTLEEIGSAEHHANQMTETPVRYFEESRMQESRSDELDIFLL